MRTLIVIALALVRCVQAGDGCPSLCACRGGKALDGADTAETSSTEWLRLKCGGVDHLISELNDIDLAKIDNRVATLNLSGNAISILSRELHLPALQKLDLSRNQISVIEPDAFYKLPGLQRLDLSFNKIASVPREVFQGLTNLERLFMSNNNITTLSADNFKHLPVLKQLDISDNPLHCDCTLLGLSDWARETAVKLSREPRCTSPAGLSGKQITKLRRELPQCAGTDRLLVTPAVSQVVFEGDSLTLVCRAPFTQPDVHYELKWLHPILEVCDVNVTATPTTDEGAAETRALLANVTEHHAGHWSCRYSAGGAALAETVELIVLSNKTKYCRVTDETNNKGHFSWPQLLVNRTAAVTCATGNNMATRTCLHNATWAHMDTSACPYTNNITKILHQFALLNASLTRGAALAAAQHLARRVRQSAAEMTDADDVMLVAKAVRNYMRYAAKERDTASYLIDVISATMNVSGAAAAAAERRYAACSDLVASAEQLTQYTTDIQGHKSNMVVERFIVRRTGPAGVTCVWYSLAGDSARRLHCSTERALQPPSTLPGAVIHCSVQIPLSLLLRVQSNETEPAAAYSLVVAMYDTPALFPLFPEVDDDGAQRGHRLKDYYGRSTKREDMVMEITSPVVGVWLLNATVTSRLPEPIYVVLRSGAAGTAGGGGGVGGGGGGGGVRAALWDPRLRIWSNYTPDCSVVHAKDDTIIRCFRLGYIGLIQNVETGIYGGRTDGARFKFSHPAVYVGSLILLGCLSCTTLTYVTCYSAIQMAKKAKHALVNTWIAVSLLCFIYTLGIYQTEDMKLCQVLGLIIHYLSLCVLLWMVVSASNMYRIVYKHRATVQTSEDEIAEMPVQKPILGIYLVGWGIALIVCGISGAVNIRDYAAYAQCFLSTLPSMSALFVPAGIILTLLLILFLLIRCTIRNVNGQLSEGTQATENVDLDMWEPPPVPNEAAERRSLRSGVDSEIEDVEHSTIVQLRAQIIVLCLYLAVWVCGAVAVYRPFPAYLPYQEDICSIVYAVCATVLGTFILFFYGIARSDVREQWLLMQCYFKKSKKCCRNRSVFDANAPNLQRERQSVQRPANDNNSRSGSRSSNRTNSKTNNSGNFKGGELNGHTMRESVKNGKKMANIDLVVLNRQHSTYRSNNSILTSRDNSTPGPELFYNPNQSNVARKFFKKQKQNMKRNCLELPSRSAYDVASPNSDSYSGVAHMLHSGSKVNNTNLHVEKCQQSDVKETRHPHDPNILEEDKREAVYKNWKEDSKNRVMNIYTNVPETTTPQHQTATSRVGALRGSVSEECVPEMRTVSQQCSLAYSSASETMLDRSEHTLDTQSELTSLQETHSALCSTNEITDTESFGQYIDYAQCALPPAEQRLDKSLQDISEECTVNSEELNRSHNSGLSHDRKVTPEGSADSKDDKEGYYTPKFNSETCSANASEHFENESDIYIPNYQMSEVSIRSHGLYAPSPGALCSAEISFSHEDVSNRYVNFDPAWRQTIRHNPRCKAAGSCPDVRDGSPVSGSELDELYTRITSNNLPPLMVSSKRVIEADSDSCVSEVYSDAEIKAETTV